MVGLDPLAVGVERRRYCVARLNRPGSQCQSACYPVYSQVKYEIKETTVFFLFFSAHGYVSKLQTLDHTFRIIKFVVDRSMNEGNLNYFS